MNERGFDSFFLLLRGRLRRTTSELSALTTTMLLISTSTASTEKDRVHPSISRPFFEGGGRNRRYFMQSYALSRIHRTKTIAKTTNKSRIQAYATRSSKEISACHRSPMFIELDGDIGQLQIHKWGFNSQRIGYNTENTYLVPFQHTLKFMLYF